jgi:hypothetical protein
MEMTETARELYQKACAGEGEDKEFTEQVVALVARSSEDLEELASRFDCEAKIMRQAAKLARHEMERAKGIVHNPKGNCDRCKAEMVAVGRTTGGLYICLSCQVLG